MPSPLDELRGQIEELRLDIEFVAIASQLKPRIASVVQWKPAVETLELVRRFIKAEPTRPESVYGPLLVRLMAAFERFVRQLVCWAVDARTSRARQYSDLPPQLISRNLVLSGRLLSTLDSPRDYLVLDVGLLLDNLASCRRGFTGAFHLNGQAFSAAVLGVSPDNVEKAFKNIGVMNWWDAVGADSELVGALGTKGSRATGSRCRDVLKELSRLRNLLAHGEDVAVVITENQLRDAIAFILALSKSLDRVVSREITRN